MLPYYTYKVDKNIDEDGAEIFEVVEYSDSPDSVMDSVDRTFIEEHDAIAHAYFMNAWQKLENYDLAIISAVKHVQQTGLKLVNLDFPFFNKQTGEFNTNGMWERIWNKV